MSDGAAGGGAGGTTGLSGMPGSSGVSGGPHRSWVVALVCGVLPAALLAVIVAVPAALWSRLPARVADHWTITGTANGTAPRLAALVTVGYGAFGLRLTRIPLRRIASAAAVEQTARAFGYRGNLHVFGAAAVVLRRGPALRLTLRDGKTFLVTVDDAATGAALLNDLIARKP